MKPTTGDVVTAVVYGTHNTVRAEVRKSWKRRFIAAWWTPNAWPTGDAPEGLNHRDSRSFERADEGKTWVRGWEDETAVAFRAEIALLGCR